MIRIILNGTDCDVPDGLTVDQLLHHLEMGGRPLLVEHNGVALLKSEWIETTIHGADRVELVSVVAGG